jgi:hypothetical protein
VSFSPAVKLFAIVKDDSVDISLIISVSETQNNCSL